MGRDWGGCKEDDLLMSWKPGIFIPYEVSCWQPGWVLDFLYSSFCLSFFIIIWVHWMCLHSKFWNPGSERPSPAPQIHTHAWAFSPSAVALSLSECLPHLGILRPMTWRWTGYPLLTLKMITLVTTYTYVTRHKLKSPKKGSIFILPWITHKQVLFVQKCWTQSRSSSFRSPYLAP